ncbi:MAG: molybdopterin-synthase adenylyltransferase MoeB [Alphaproteobacteria bacterium]|nr:molybdopterin-synthase adenylyltransferase MoeB [Alphaproteobacteria bacterium]
MLSASDTQRFLRHLVLREVGAQGQQALLAARVVMVGAGGLGGPVIQYLAAAGVGRIDVVDNDRVDLTNLQRQVQFATADIGKLKAERAAELIRAINPNAVAKAFPEKLDDGNAVRLIAGADLVVDGVDDFETRFALNRASMAARVPLLSGAIGRFDGRISLFAPFDGDLPCLGCLMPESPPHAEVLNCAEEGVLGPVAGVVGTMLALEAVKLIVGIGRSLAGDLIIYDALDNVARRVRLPRDPQCAHCGKLDRA